MPRFNDQEIEKDYQRFEEIKLALKRAEMMITYYRIKIKREELPSPLDPETEEYRLISIDQFKTHIREFTMDLDQILEFLQEMDNDLSPKDGE